jgi:phosphinothricin acetyltransferase
MNCLIRDSREDDITAVHSIYAYHVLTGSASFEEDPPSMEELLRRRADVLARGLPYIVAEAEGRVVGYSYATPYRSRSAYRFTIENSVYVAHGLSRRGIGRTLLSTLIARCESGEWRQMVAIIGDTNNTGSIVLHEHLGFRRVGVLQAVGYKFGQWVDSVLMQRALGAGADTLPDEKDKLTTASSTAGGVGLLE